MNARRGILALLTLGALAGAPAAHAAVGSAGVGDKYFPKAGNGGYDVRHYRLLLDYDPVTDLLDGDARIRARAAERLRSFHLDFLGPTISELTVDGDAATFERKGQELIVTPEHAVRGTFVARVVYSGTPGTVTDPDGSSEGWTTTADGSAALGEPQGSPTWFPSNNHPTDKATYKFRVTVPTGITAIANGELVAQTPNGGGTEFVWRERDPMASYLAVLATGVFTLDDDPVAGIPSWIAADPLAAATDTSVLADMHPFLASLFGPYPFDSTGAILDVNPTLGYALETQTKPYYSIPPGAATLVHELAHQWYGDSVTLGRWKDIWLNEGFATYAEWLWDEETGGASPQQTFDDLYATPASDGAFWNPPPGNPKPEGMFDGTVYERGAMALHAIRMEIGDSDFFELLPAWHERYEGSHATTPKLLKLAEEISGEQLDDLFDAWLYEPGKPAA